MISMPSTQGPIPADDTLETVAAWHAGIDPGVHRAATPPSPPWALQAEEATKMGRLERGETLPLSTTVEHCLDRVAKADSAWNSSRFRLVFHPARQHPPRDDEVAAMLAEVPLCLLNGHERALVLEQRQRGPRAPGPACPMDLTVACMEALNAARGDRTVPRTQALARLARWETDAPSAREAQARAHGGRALRQAVKDPSDPTLHLMEDVLNPDAREFSLPPRALLAALDLGSRALLADLGRARPLHLQAFRDSVPAMALSHWDLCLTDQSEASAALIPDRAKEVGLRGDTDRCCRLALELVSQPGRDLQKVRIHAAAPASAPGFPQAPAGWRVDPEASTWTLCREAPPATATASAASVPQTSSHSLRT